MRARELSALRRSWLLGQYAHRNRAELTRSEARLWSALKARQLGVQFRRQVPLAEQSRAWSRALNGRLRPLLARHASPVPGVGSV